MVDKKNRRDLISEVVPVPDILHHQLYASNEALMTSVEIRFS